MRIFIQITLFLSLILIINTGLQAQAVSYGYDAAGNRISRVIVLAQLRVDEQEEILKEDVYSEVIRNMEIRIYPNPTNGLLKVELSNLPSGQQVNLFLFDLSGKLILEKSKVQEFTEIDISNHPAGNYILKIYIGEVNTEWKIIKKQ